MGIQAICNGTNPKPMCVDVQTLSINGLEMKDHGSLGDEFAPKVRKPYTITKQRERWTEEEHNKFLEALQLYGRAWRRIEDHIRTKTAVQIRSHAQKFFSKVVRESKAIEIPPPRPKRKPVHPYPRKIGNPLINGGLTIGKLGRSSAEPDNGSPTSVLSAFGSDTMNLFLSNMKNRCTSPVTSGVGSNEQDSSTEETGQKQNQSAMDASVPCLKLFGKTVMVTPSVESKSKSPIDVESRDKIPNVHLGSSALPVLPMFCPVPSIYSSSMNHPWMFLCGNSSLPFLHQQNSKSRHVVSQPCVETPSDKATQNECSWTGPNMANEGGHVVSSKCTKRARSVDNGEHVGFVPYKRYAVNDDGEDQSTGLCL